MGVGLDGRRERLGARAWVARELRLLRHPWRPGLRRRLGVYRVLTAGGVGRAVLGQVLVAVIPVTVVVAAAALLVASPSTDEEGARVVGLSIVGTLLVLALLAVRKVLLLDASLQLVGAGRPELPRLDGSLVEPAWADARTIDVDEYAATIDAGLQAAMGWEDEHVERIRLLPWVPMMVVAEGALALREVASGTIVGGARVGPDPAVPEGWSVGLWLGAAHRGRGLGVAALRALVEASRLWGAPPLVLATAVENLPMQAAARRAGATEIDRRPHVLADGQVITALVFRLPPVLDPPDGAAAAEGESVRSEGGR